MAPRCIEPAKGPVEAHFRAMPSKSATHRALVAAALADGVSVIQRPLDADDTRRTLEGLRRLGVRIEEDHRDWIVRGAAGAPVGGGTIDLGASGTSARFLTALAALGGHRSVLDGSPRLRERPMDELLGALSRLGATIQTSGASVYPIRAGGSVVTGGAVTLSGARSSQFASALLLAAPAFQMGLRLVVVPPRVSFPYVRMTVEMLESFGARVDTIGEAEFSVARQRLRAATLRIEGDHSSASYMFAAAAILGGRIAMRGLRENSTQPDARFLKDLAALGCTITSAAEGVVLEAPGRIPAFAWDLADAPDLAPTAAVLAVFSGGPCTLSGLGHLPLKESNRLEALRDNVTRLGAQASVNGGTLTIVPPGRESFRGGTIEVADDHRIAMALAVAGLAIPGVVIDHPEVVTKSYPRFWNDLDALVRTGS
jgi:3-phosphoshikimate 1-carboxyvinyltransferase